jgi:hypothetical protein
VVVLNETGSLHTSPMQRPPPLIIHIVRGAAQRILIDLVPRENAQAWSVHKPHC